MSIDKATKAYKAALKESQTVLEGLEDEARRYAAMEVNRRDAEQGFENAQTRLEDIAAEKETVKDELSEAVLTGDDVDGLRERYAQLTRDEDELRATLGDATRAMLENTPDAGEVARVRAALHTFKASGESELLDAVKAVVQSDADSLRARSEAAQGLLPDVDSLTLLGALGEYTEAYRALYAGHRQNIEREDSIDPVRGQKARERLDYQLESILARA